MKTRLLDQLELAYRQAAEDRRQFGDLLLEFQQLNERQHQSTTGLVQSVAQSVMEQSQGFNRYLDLVSPKGETQVRIMNDEVEADLERKWMESRGVASPEIDTLDPNLASESAMSATVEELLKSFSQAG